MTLTFRYKETESPDGKKALRPVIPVIMIGPKETFETTCILDSGADLTIISKNMAEVLGLDLSGEIDLSYGVGGEIPTLKSHVNIVDREWT